MIAVAAVAAALAATVGAGSAAAATGCEGQVYEQPFTRWLDYASYTLVPGGTFESSLTGWTLAGGAKVVSGNEPFDVHGNGESHSLSLPAGSSATTPTMCVTLAHPDLRFFARNTGSSLSALAVSVTFPTLLGQVTLPVSAVVAGPSWAPTLPLPIVLNTLALVSPDGTIPVSFRFTPVLGGNWQIDDTYVDPFKGR